MQHVGRLVRALAVGLALSVLWLNSAEALSPSARVVLFAGCPQSVQIGGQCPAGPSLNFSTGTYWVPGQGNVPLASLLSVSRASTKMCQYANGTWVSVSNNVPCVTDQGALIEEARTNLFLNSQSPATQTVTVTSGQTYTVSVYGTATVTLSGGGTGTATQGSPRTFTATTTSVVCTVTGAGGSFQNVNFELGSFATSPIVTAGASATRAADVPQLTGAAASAALAAKAAFFQTTGVNVGAGASMMTATGGRIIAASSTTLQFDNGVNTAIATAGAGTYAGVLKSAQAWDGTSFWNILAGGAKVTSANALTFTGTFTLGNRVAGDRALNGYMQRFTLSPVKGAFDNATSP